jgi:hypothetical protein
MHLDVSWECAFKDSVRVRQLRITCGQPLIQRRDESALEFAGRSERHERERGEDAEPDRAIGHRTSVKFVRDMVCLAKSERQTEHDVLADLIQNMIGESSNVGMVLGQSRSYWQCPAPLADCQRSDCSSLTELSGKHGLGKFVGSSAGRNDLGNDHFIDLAQGADDLLSIQRHSSFLMQ